MNGLSYATLKRLYKAAVGITLCGYVPPLRWDQLVSLQPHSGFAQTLLPANPCPYCRRIFLFCPSSNRSFPVLELA